MSKRIKWICILSVLAVIVLFFLGAHIIGKHYILIMQKNELLFEVDSPDSRYRLLAYDTSGGATSPWSVGAIVESADGKFKKTLFKAQFENNIEAYWIDEYKVNINGVTLDIRYDTFDNTRLDFRQQRYDTYNLSALKSKKPESMFDRIVFWLVCGKKTWE